MAEKNTANIGFEKQIWDAACVLWGHIPAAEYPGRNSALCGTGSDYRKKRNQNQ